MIKEIMINQLIKCESYSIHKITSIRIRRVRECRKLLHIHRLHKVNRKEKVKDRKLTHRYKQGNTFIQIYFVS